MKEYLDNLLRKEKVPQALLFAGSHFSEKEPQAFSLAHRLLKSDPAAFHPDLHIYSPEGKLGLHSMETLKILSEEVYLAPYAAKCKVFIIKEAERMSTISANAILKTLEDPLPTSYIFLLSTFPERLLPTIRSRCQILYFRIEKSVEPIVFPSLLLILRSLHLLTYPELFEQLNLLANDIEKQAHIAQEASAAEHTAYQKQLAEKKREGSEALTLFQLTQACFSQILGWFRDLHLLHLQGNQENLFFPQEVSLTMQWLERGILPSLAHVAEDISQAEKSLGRSTPLRNTLENLFIALKKRCHASH